MINFFDPPRHPLTRDDPSAFAAPAQFGPFRVLHQIGVGALGPVFRTYEPERDRLVAVKVFRLDVTPEQAQTLAGELSRAADAGLFHPSIVEPIAAGVEGSVAYGAEEYVAAESLDVAMRHYAPAAIETVLPFITQLAGAIDFARAAGVGHGALHPRDIFMTPDEARATGFGVVEALERVGLRAPVRRPYSPPERIAGEPWGTPADVFSLAAITYELITARRPAGLGSELGPLTAGTPNGWMDAIHAVLASGMDADPDARYPTALAFASALEAAARGQTAGATAPRTPARAAAPPIVPVVPAEGPARSEALPEIDRPFAAAAPGTSQENEAVETGDIDDISAERDEDEAHHQLSLRDAREDRQDGGADPEAPAFLLDEDAEAEASADRFMLDVADSAAHEPDGRLSRHSDLPGAAPAALSALDDDDDVAAVPMRTATPPSARPPAVADRVPRPLMPAGMGAAPAPPSRSRGVLAAVLVGGLLLGLVGGYAIWGGSATEAPAGTPASAGGPAPEATSETEGEVVDLPVAPRAESVPAEEAPPAAASPIRATSGTIVVRSTPSGAGVRINGTWRGRTPLTLDKLALGRYEVRVVETGYAPVNEAIALTAGSPSRSLSFRLKEQARADAAPRRPAPAAPRRAAPAAPRQSAPAAARAQPAGPTRYTGSIYVDSRPRGARVSIDGEAVGVTPLRVPEVRIGTRIVRLELPDHRIWSSTARVAADQESRVTGSLERIQ